jgi:hypothetical protein
MPARGSYFLLWETGAMRVKEMRVKDMWRSFAAIRTPS